MSPSAGSSPGTGVYDPKAFVLHAASLGQGCPHCPIFLTAASRRSLGRVSVPVWLIVLSDQLPVVALVGRYLTNKLMGRETLTGYRHETEAGFPHHPKGCWAYGALATLSSSYSPPGGRFLTRYSPVRHYRVLLPGKPFENTQPFDLHVLGTPPAFVLSQDQTLRDRSLEKTHAGPDRLTGKSNVPLLKIAGSRRNILFSKCVFLLPCRALM